MEKRIASICESHGSSLWKSNRSEWDIFSNYDKFVVRDGIHVSLWQNVGRELALNGTFPDLCLLTKNKDASIALNLCWSREGGKQ